MDRFSNAWYLENSEHRYELHDGVIVEVPKPTGKHSEVAGFTSGELFLEIRCSHVDYLGLGGRGRRYLGNPKRPTLSVYQLVKGEFSCEQFREGKQIFSPMRSNMTQPIAVGTKRS